MRRALRLLAAELIARPKPAQRDPQARHGWSVVRCTAVLVVLGALPLALLLDDMRGAAMGGPSLNPQLGLGTLLLCAALLTSALMAPVLLLMRQHECPQPAAAGPDTAA